MLMFAIYILLLRFIILKNEDTHHNFNLFYIQHFISNCYCVQMDL